MNIITEVLIACVAISITLVSIMSFRDKSDKKAIMEGIKHIISLLGVIATVAAGVSIINMNINSAISNAVSISTASSVSNANADTTVNLEIPVDMTLDQILQLAENAISEQKYEDAFRYYLYDVDGIKQNSIRNTNIGYLHAHGYGVGADIDKAIESYNTAIQNKDEQAYINKLVLFLRDIRDAGRIEETIIEGCDLFPRVIDRFLRACAEESDGAVQYLSAESFSGLSSEDRQNTINSLYHWEKTDIVNSDHDNITDTDTVMHSLISAYYPKNDNNRTLPSFIYQRWELFYYGMSSLEETYEKVSAK